MDDHETPFHPLISGTRPPPPLSMMIDFPSIPKGAGIQSTTSICPSQLDMCILNFVDQIFVFD